MTRYRITFEVDTNDNREIVTATMRDMMKNLNECGSIVYAASEIIPLPNKDIQRIIDYR